MSLVFKEKKCVFYFLGILHNIRDTGAGIRIKINTIEGGRVEVLNSCLPTRWSTNKRIISYACIYISVVVCDELLLGVGKTNEHKKL